MAIVDCVADRAKSSAGGDPIWNVGGPDAGLSMRDQGELLAKIVEKEPKLLAVPTARARRGRGVKLRPSLSLASSAPFSRCRSGSST